ncbi:hypothetical protein GJ744_006295 [Endocarpon pusillum]|uniref:Uncharacterized protein n=1 Tax=Endocarpon pusillum TaxID=364733 RepID=A0A8H7A431_9EURO|nr:hypothetical protein GJ744_006295 [Endocarpon pusillum]
MNPYTKRFLVKIAVFAGLSLLAATQLLGPDHVRNAETRRRLGIEAKGGKQPSDHIGRRRLFRHEHPQRGDPGVSAAVRDLDTTWREQRTDDGGGKEF